MGTTRKRTKSQATKSKRKSKATKFTGEKFRWLDQVSLDFPHAAARREA